MLWTVVIAKKNILNITKVVEKKCYEKDIYVVDLRALFTPVSNSIIF